MAIWLAVVATSKEIGFSGMFWRMVDYEQSGTVKKPKISGQKLCIKQKPRHYAVIAQVVCLIFTFDLIYLIYRGYEKQCVSMGCISGGQE